MKIREKVANIEKAESEGECISESVYKEKGEGSSERD
jgi:hypothetical protein